MSYTPPSYSSVDFDFTKSYTPLSYNSVNIEFVQNILELDSANIALTTNPILLTRTYKLDLTASSFVSTLSSVTLVSTHKLDLNPSTYALTLSNVSYGNIIRNLNSSYNLTLNPVGLIYSKVPIIVDSSSFISTLSDVNLVHNYKLNLSEAASILAASNIDLTYTATAAKIDLVLTEVLLGLSSVGFYKTHAPLNLNSLGSTLSASSIGYGYNKVLSIPSKSSSLSYSLSLKWDRISIITTNNSTLSLSDIGITSNKKVSIVDIPTILSSNDISFLYSRNLILSSSASLLSLQDVGLRNNRIIGIGTNTTTLTTNDLLYKYYRLNLSNSPVISHLQDIISKHNYLLNLQSSSTSLSIQDVVVMVLEPFIVEEVLVLVGDTNTLLSAVTEKPVLSIANTSIINTTSYPKLIETLEDKLLSTTHKVTLINITSKD